MKINLDTTATIAKSINIKREKDAKENEVVVAHLKFSTALITRDQMDEICQQRPGWADQSFFDSLGMPSVLLEIGIRCFEASVTGTIRGNEAESVITLRQARLTDVVLSLHKLGALFSGHLSWAIAGDEASDAECLLGQVCGVRWVIQEPEQGDWLKDAMRRGDVTVKIEPGLVA